MEQKGNSIHGGHAGLRVTASVGALYGLECYHVNGHTDPTRTGSAMIGFVGEVCVYCYLYSLLGLICGSPLIATYIAGRLFLVLAGEGWG